MNSILLRRMFGLLVVGAAVMWVLVAWRGFFWQHAAMIGIAVMALVYSGLGTVRRLRDLYGERRDLDE